MNLFEPQIKNIEPDSLGIYHKQIKKKSKNNFLIKKINYLTNEEMTFLNIPNFLQHSYLNGLPLPKITKLREWQYELINSDNWRNGNNFIILIPTSGGKTLISDIAIAQQLNLDNESKSIYTLPFVSLAEEKTNEYKKRFFDFKIKPFYQNIGGNNFSKGSIAICTFEKAHILINNAIKQGYISQIKTLIIDEIHMIGDESRGHIIESLIIKCLLLNHKIRIIGLTATLNFNDTIKISKWIKGNYFISNKRPSIINSYFLNQNGELYSLKNNKFELIKKIQNNFLFILNNSLINNINDTILIFVNSRKQTQNLSIFILNNLLIKIQNLFNENLINKRINLINKLKNNGNIDNNLFNCILNGICFHHAGMLIEDRKLIENALKESIISIIVATTTLSAGININSIKTIIINDLYRFKDSNNKILISKSLFIQMSGRASRKENNEGNVYLLSQNNNMKELKDSVSLISNELDNINSTLLLNENIDKYYLQCIEFKFDLNLFFKNLFIYNNLTEVELLNLINSINLRLIEKDILNKNLEISKLGLAISDSSLNINEGLKLNKLLKKLNKGINLNNDINLLYICIPINFLENEYTPNYDYYLWEYLIFNFENILKNLIKFNLILFQKHLFLTNKIGGKYKKYYKLDKKLDRFYFSCILQEIINEKNLDEISKKYLIPIGIIQSLQFQTSNYINQIIKFCENMNYYLISISINTFKKRLDFGINNELISLLKIPSCNKIIAKKFFNNQIKNIFEVADLSIDKIIKIISNNEINDEIIEKAQKILNESIKISKNLKFLETLEDYSYNNFILFNNEIEVY